MKYALVNGIILNGCEDMQPQSGMAVVVEGERIAAIVPEAELDRTGCEVIDLKGQYLLPGLVNLHVHLPSSGKAPKANAKPTDYKKLFNLLAGHKLVLNIFMAMQEKLVRQELMSGVTTLRAVGGVLDLDSQLRDKINAGKTVGPRILAANTGVSVPGGHFAGSLATEATCPEDAVRDIRGFMKSNPDLIKLMITGGVMDASEEGEPGVLRMSPEIVKAACDEAHKYGLPVAAHVESAEGVRVALENGVDTIEHGAKPDEEIIRLFKERGAVLVCTLSPVMPYALMDDEVSHCGEIGKKNGQIVLQGIIDCARACLENGVTVGIGTDTGCNFIRHYDTWRELVYFTKYCDVTTQYALYTATKLNAEILGLGDETGSIEVGKCADLIVVKDNPLDDLTTLRNVKMVMARGRLFRDPKIKKDKYIDSVLDKYL